MRVLSGNQLKRIIILVAGVEGAVGSTLAVAAAALEACPQTVAPFLTAGGYLAGGMVSADIRIAGWDTDPQGLVRAAARQHVVDAQTVGPLAPILEGMPVRPAPPRGLTMRAAVDALAGDIAAFREADPQAPAVLVNLLPACAMPSAALGADIRQLTEQADPDRFPDLAYVLAALKAGIPVVNFTPNRVELPAVCQAFQARALPLCGRDGKTGQTFFKTVLASAFRRRSLRVDGWYSLNILGNADGRNLMDPDRAAGKLANKTGLLDEILGYAVGTADNPAHKVHIDYYPPRGDAKEAWDVIDFAGIFGMPMSLRVNLQGRDSILAAPLAIDLACWAAALQKAGIGGPVAELAFYFKKAVGDNPPVTFEDQVAALAKLADKIKSKVEAEVKDTKAKGPRLPVAG